MKCLDSNNRLSNINGLYISGCNGEILSCSSDNTALVAAITICRTPKLLDLVTPPIPQIKRKATGIIYLNGTSLTSYVQNGIYEYISNGTININSNVTYYNNYKYISSGSLSFSGESEYFPLGWDIQLAFRGDTLTEDFSWFNASDPSLMKTADGWTMFFTSINSSNNKLYTISANLTGNLSSNSWILNTTPIISPSSNISDWDYSAIETPCYVRGKVSGEWVDRIYYTGWKDSSLNGGLNNYAIGMAEYNGSSWDKNPTPVITFTPASFGTIGGDPGVFYVNDKWYIYYQMGLSDNSTVTMQATSDDGLNWTNHTRVSFHPSTATSNLPDGPYFVDLKSYGSKYYLTGWLPVSPIEKQGIYTTVATDLEAQDFNEWIPILYEGPGPDWFEPNNETLHNQHILGLFGSTLIQEDDKLWLFFHSVVRTIDDTNNFASIGFVKVSPRLLQF